MRTLSRFAILTALTSASLFGGVVSVFDGSITLTLIPDASAAAGSDFHWQFTLENDTTKYLFLNSVDSSFLFDSNSLNNPPVTADLALFNSTYFADGLPPGTTSSPMPLAFYSIAPGAAPGQVGNNAGPCCVLTISFDGFSSAGAADYFDSSTADSDFTAVVISGDAFVDAPEPAGVLLIVGGLLILVARVRFLGRMPKTNRNSD
jgi:hypothetical protein